MFVRGPCGQASGQALRRGSVHTNNKSKNVSASAAPIARSSSSIVVAAASAAAPSSSSSSSRTTRRHRASSRNNTTTASAAAGDIGAMISGLKKALSGPGAAAGPARPISASFADNAPSWAQLEGMVRAQEAQHGARFLEPDLDGGDTHPLALRRTFGSSEPPRVKLYRDHAAWCPYCQKVWLQLEEKRIPYGADAAAGRRPCCLLCLLCVCCSACACVVYFFVPAGVVPPCSSPARPC